MAKPGRGHALAKVKSQVRRLKKRNPRLRPFAVSRQEMRATRKLSGCHVNRVGKLKAKGRPKPSGFFGNFVADDMNLKNSRRGQELPVGVQEPRIAIPGRPGGNFGERYPTGDKRQLSKREGLKDPIPKSVELIVGFHRVDQCTCVKVNAMTGKGRIHHSDLNSRRAASISSRLFERDRDFLP